MIKYFNKNNLSGLLKNRSLIFAAIVIAWLPAFWISFLNDDYQILSYHNHGSFWDILSPFWQADVSGYYWRPLGNIIQPLILLTAGFNPFVFHTTSIIIYGLCCYYLAKAIEITGIKREYAVLTAILFAILPSHEYQIAWIADQGESIVTLFLLLTFIYYGRNKIIALLFFIAALLVKESSFTGIFIPLLYLFVESGKEKKKIIYLRDILIGLGLIGLLLTYRFMVIGGSLLSSGNFQNTGPLKWILNFFIYIPLSFISPDNLERIMLSNDKTIFITMSVLVIIIVIYLIFIFRSLAADKKRILYLGLGWFIIFIFPALPKMMRWYVFTASIGFAFIFSSIVEQVNKKRIFAGIISILIVLILYSDISRMMTWKESGDKMDGIVAGLKVYKGRTNFTLWCVPEKYENTPLMKLGISQAMGFAVNDMKTDVSSPLRCEIYSTDSDVEYKKENDSTLMFYLRDGRFKSLLSNSSSYIKTEQFSFTDEGYRIEVNNGISGTNYSEARVVVPGSKKGMVNLYFNGKGFEEINWAAKNSPINLIR